MINLIKEVVNKYTTYNRVKEMMHNQATQICEALNYLLIIFAAKSTKNSRTDSLKLRKCHVVSIHNDGYTNIIQILLKYLVFL